MKIRNCCILLVLFLSLFITTRAQVKHDIVPTEQQQLIPFSLGHVSDYVKLFTGVQVQQMDSLMADFEKRSTIQIALVTLDSAFTLPEQFDAYTLTLANEWGVGQKGKDNGILIAISKQFRKMRIQNGMGIENLLSNEVTSSIIQDYFIPSFKKDAYYDGTFNGLQRLIHVLENNRQSL